MEETRLEAGPENYIVHKLVQNTSENMESDSGHVSDSFLSDNSSTQKSKLYCLTIQIDKIYLKPLPKFNKNNDSQNENKLLCGQSEDNSKSVENNQNSHLCLVCKKTFTNTSEFYKHVKEHFTCDICSTEFTSRISYKKHYEIHESKNAEFPYKCHICDMLFQAKEKIRNHNHISLDKYDGNKQNKIHYCKSCNITFRNESTYRRHLNSHVIKATHILGSL